MDTCVVTQDQIAVLYRAAESEDPLELVRRCLKERGLPVWSRAKVELFVRGEQRLLLARPASPVRRRVRQGEPRVCRRRR